MSDTSVRVAVRSVSCSLLFTSIRRKWGTCAGAQVTWRWRLLC